VDCASVVDTFIARGVDVIASHDEALDQVVDATIEQDLTNGFAGCVRRNFSVRVAHSKILLHLRVAVVENARPFLCRLINPVRVGGIRARANHDRARGLSRRAARDFSQA
jgi:hypothetical protein